MVRSVKCLVYRRGNLSSDLQHQCKSHGMAEHKCNACTGEAGRGITGAHGLASLPESGSSWDQWETVSKKIKVGKQTGKDIWNVFILTHTYATYGYTHKHSFKNQTKTYGVYFLETWNNQTDNQAVPGELTRWVKGQRHKEQADDITLEKLIEFMAKRNQGDRDGDESRNSFHWEITSQCSHEEGKVWSKLLKGSREIFPITSKSLNKYI